MTGHPSAIHVPLRRLPLVTLYVTERCNSRCVSCDYWRHGRGDMGLDAVERLLPDLAQLGTQVVLLSGGEPLLNPEWAPIAGLLKENGIEVWLLTSGLSLAKHARRAADLFDSITVSLDGADRETYRAIRGLDAFDKVCEGIDAAAVHGLPPGIRVTLQRANYRQLPALVDLAKRIGARGISFLAADSANSHAFGRTNDLGVRTGDAGADLALSPDDLPVFERVLCSLEQDHFDDFRSGFIAESPQKLRRILQYFAACCGQDVYPTVRCNAPEFSTVIGATGRVQPCFFIPGPSDARLVGDGDRSPRTLAGTLNGDGMATLRASIRSGARVECRTCVCSMWRDLGTFTRSDFISGAA